MNIFVGNLAFDATQDDMKKLFEGFGNVTSAVIVMSKEKKAPKSRGFGFVEMPDEEQALAAIAALNEKEFMGRILNISQARPNPRGVGLSRPIKEGPKTEADRQSELKMKMQLRAQAKAELLLRKEQEQQKVLANPILGQRLALSDGKRAPSGQHLAPRPNGGAGTPPSAVDGRVRPSRKRLALSDGKRAPSRQPGTYKGGRRTHSYMKRLGLTEMQEEAKPRQRSQDNPMRWRKRKNQSKPWQKSPGEDKPWKNTEGDAKPWSKSSERPQKSRFKSRRKPGGYQR